MTGATAPTPAPEPMATGQLDAVALVDPAAPGLPARLVLRGALDPVTAPALAAAVATAAGTGFLLVDVSRVDRFDPAVWEALAGACARAVEGGASVHVAGLRWVQVLDVLAAAPVVRIGALMTGIRVLLPGPGDQAPDTTPAEGDGTPGWLRAPASLPPPPAIVPGGVPVPRRATGTVGDHLPRDWSRPDLGAGRG